MILTDVNDLIEEAYSQNSVNRYTTLLNKRVKSGNLDRSIADKLISKAASNVRDKTIPDTAAIKRARTARKNLTTKANILRSEKDAAGNLKTAEQLATDKITADKLSNKALAHTDTLKQKLNASNPEGTFKAANSTGPAPNTAELSKLRNNNYKPTFGFMDRNREKQVQIALRSKKYETPRRIIAGVGAANLAYHALKPNDDTTNPIKMAGYAGLAGLAGAGALKYHQMTKQKEQNGES